MKRIVVLFLFICALLPASVKGQAGLSDSTKFIHRAWLSEQRRAVLLTIGLTEFEKASFWPVYESYCNAKEYLEVEYLNIVMTYSDYLNSSDQATAEQLYRVLLINDCDLAMVRLKYYRRICRALPASKANAFMRLDESFRILIRDRVRVDSSREFGKPIVSSSIQQFGH